MELSGKIFSVGDFVSRGNELGCVVACCSDGQDLSSLSTHGTRSRRCPNTTPCGRVLAVSELAGEQPMPRSVSAGSTSQRKGSHSSTCESRFVHRSACASPSFAAVEHMLSVAGAGWHIGSPMCIPWMHHCCSCALHIGLPMCTFRRTMGAHRLADVHPLKFWITHRHRSLVSLA